MVFVSTVDFSECVVCSAEGFEVAKEISFQIVANIKVTSKVSKSTGARVGHFIGK